jgi:excisionase family DNA binding protein
MGLDSHVPIQAMPTTAPQRRLHPIPETAEILSLGRTKLIQLLDDGVIDSIYIGGRRLVPDEAINAFIAHADRSRTHRRGRAARTTDGGLPQVIEVVESDPDAVTAPRRLHRRTNT